MAGNDAPWADTGLLKVALALLLCIVDQEDLFLNKHSKVSERSSYEEMVNAGETAGNHFPLLQLQRELRDQILSNVLVPNCLETTDWFLGFYTTHSDDGTAHRHILGDTDSPISHPIRRTNKQLYAESTDVLRRLFSSQPFRLGPSDSWMTHLILQAMSTGLCSIVGAVTINADAFDSISGKTNHELWTGTCNDGHVGELILNKLPNLRRVRIVTPDRNCSYRIEDHSPDDKCTGERYSTCGLCALFFSDELNRGRIDKLEFVIERDVSQLTTQRDILPTDPAYPYWVASKEPWNRFDILKTFTGKDAKYWGPPRSRDELGCPEWTETSRTWTVGYQRKETGHEL
jgi:hypothetical protein